MKTADLYIRVSTDEQADKGYSQRDQEERLKKYCQVNGLRVGKIMFEDHSAKTFNRPIWQNYLDFLRRHKGKGSDLVLFTKWDRFSRNTGDAYQMINWLRRMEVEPQAIEQPLDTSIPENKLMLAIYLATPEVENDRRGLNIFHGIRRAKKEGRWTGIAPPGYINRQEGSRKYIDLKEPDASIIEWVFEMIVKGSYVTNELWRMAQEKGLKISRSRFHEMVRNPVYCGKVIVPAYKDEESRWAEGQHQPIISEHTFWQVQDRLKGWGRKTRIKRVSHDRLPLRGFLICPDCGKVLTGSASKGRSGYYYYYHCAAPCRARFKAEDANQLFLNELRKLKPKPGRVEVFREVVKGLYSSETDHLRVDRRNLLDRINKETNRLSKARELLLKGDIDGEDYKQIKTESNRKIDEMEKRLSALGSAPEKDMETIIDKAVHSLCNLDKLYENEDMEVKRKIIGSIYPENLVISETGYRTARLNKAIELMYLINNNLKRRKKEKDARFERLSRYVVPPGIEPGTHGFSVHCSTN